MWNKVKGYIEKYKLLEYNKLYIVALSGGPDSIALLLLLKEAGYNIHAAHCNFRLRGAESDRDEQFCVALCENQSIPLHRVHFDTDTYAQLHKISMEMAARELRYRWFEDLRNDIGADGVCVAHHRDDVVETVLMNLVRGTGLRGLTGIQPRNGSILRPLLGVSRQEIETFLSVRHQVYVTDTTNLEAVVQRNKIRLEVLPLLRQLNPAVSDAIWRTAEHLTEAQYVLDKILNSIIDKKVLKTNDINNLGSSEYFIFEWLKKYGFNGSQTKKIMTAKTGSVFTSGKGFDLLVDRDQLVIEPALKPLKSMLIPETGSYVMNDGTRLVVSEHDVTPDFHASKEPHSVTLDARQVHFPLTIRRMEQGDWMIPYGMEGRKLLSDLLTDMKRSVFEKRRQLVVVDAHGVIVWLIGVRTDNRCRVTIETRRVCRLSVYFSTF